MFDPISLAVGGVLAAAGFLAGRAGRGRPGGLPNGAVCGCQHPLAMHDPQTQECHGRTKEREMGMSQMTDCRCRQYDGPRPIEELFAPQYLPPTED
jgi:hypothetical protein